MPTTVFIAGEPALVRGKVSGKVRRPVRILVKTAKSWGLVARSRTDRRGRFRIEVPAPAVSGQVKVVAPRVKRRGVKFAKAQRTRPITVRDQTAFLSVEQVAPVRSTVAPKAMFAPARPGRPVRLQRLGDAGWVTVSNGVESSDGSVAFSLATDRVGELRLRALADAHNGAKEVATHISATDVLPTTLNAAIQPLPNVVSGTVAVRVTTDGDRAAEGVRVYLGGNLVGRARAEPDGSWLANIDTTGVENGENDLVAVAHAGGLRGISASSRIRIENDSSMVVATLPPGFHLETIASGLELPTSFAIIDSRRVLVTEKNGLVKMVVDGRVLPTPVLDLTGATGTVGDDGVLGIALAPDFAASHQFFLHFVPARTEADLAADPSGDRRVRQVARWTLRGNVADPDSKKIILGAANNADCLTDERTADCLPALSPYHAGGDLAFLPDGTLLVTVGDGVINWTDLTGKMRAQDPDVLAGKILRIDPETGLGVPGNPWFDPQSPESNRGRVWALGMRNPFRLSVDSNADVWVGDVGEFGIEEIDHLTTPGLNLGWPCFEGTAKPHGGTTECAALHDGSTPSMAPTYQYSHRNWAGSVTGGMVYEGTAWPAEYLGKYLYADYVFGEINLLDPRQTGSPAPVFAGPPSAGTPVKFALGPDGQVWYLSIGNGELRRIAYDPAVTGCPAGRFVGTYYDSADFSGEPALITCERRLPTGPGFSAPGGLWSGDFSVRWTGRPSLEPGTYALQKSSSGTLRVIVDGSQASNEFVVPGGASGTAAPAMTVELSRAGASNDEAFGLSWTPVGAPPQVHLAGVRQGVRVAPGTDLSLVASAQNSDGSPVPATDLSIRLTVLHYDGPGERAHRHYDVRPGGSTTARIEDVHAPGQIAYTIQAVAKGATGAWGKSPLTYVCLDGGLVGPCQ